MALYHFNPNGLGENYFVAAKDKELALKSLVRFLEEELSKKRKYYKENAINGSANSSDVKAWKNVDALDRYTYPKNYSIDEYEQGIVIAIN